MMYLDTNIIIYAMENHKKYGNACTKILLDVQKEKTKCTASMQVLVESINVMLKINKLLRAEGEKQLDIRKSIDAIMSLPIVWLDINFSVIKRAAEYDYAVSGADYIHIATMEINGIKKIISADAELERVDIIKRIDPLRYET